MAQFRKYSEYKMTFRVKTLLTKVLYLEHDLSEIFLVKLSKLSETELTEVWEEDPAFLLDLALHVHHLLLRGGETQRLHGWQQVLSGTS